MRSTWLIRAARSGLAGALLVATIGASVASAGPAPNRGARSRGANLFALVFGVMNVNRIFCGINNIGELCVDPTGSPVTIRRILPLRVRSKTTIGSLLSMHSEMAVVSITCSPRLSTSM